jgi:hypothetical protein
MKTPRYTRKGIRSSGIEAPRRLSGSRRLFVPEGHRETSPAFQGRGCDQKTISPEGTAETLRTSFWTLHLDQPSLRDSGCSVPIPSLEKAGLFSFVPSGHKSTSFQSALDHPLRSVQSISEMARHRGTTREGCSTIMLTKAAIGSRITHHASRFHDVRR